MPEPIPFRIKRSAVQGKRPQNADLELGELALNTYDARLFAKRDTAGVGIGTTIALLTPWTETAGVGIYYTEGNVGLGTTNPTSRIHVVGDTLVTGVVTATTFIGSLTGIAASATKLVTPRTFEITGDILASPISFDGTGNVSLAATIQPNSVGLGTDTTGDYVQTVSGTANQITVTGGTGEGSTPTLSIPSQFTAPQDVTVSRDLQVDRNLNVNGNITIGGTSATLFTTELKVSDPDLVLGFRTDSFGNDISTDNTANHGGIAVASTEGNPLVSLFIAGIETTPATYKKIMWFKAGTFAGLNTDAWLSNYAVGIGSTQFPSGTLLAAGNVQFTENDLAVVRGVNASGVITANSFRPSSGYIQAADGTNSFYIYSGTGDVAFQGKINTSQINNASGYKALDFGTTTTPSVNITNSLNVGSGVSVVGVITASSFSGNATSATYATSSGIATYATSSGIATYAPNAGIATYANVAGIATNVIGGIASVTQLNVSGIATIGGNLIVNGNTLYVDAVNNRVGILTTSPIQPFQVGTGSSVVVIDTMGEVGIGVTNPIHPFQVGAAGATTFVVTGIGSVGIGTTNPTSKLTVNGDTSVSGLTTTFQLSVAGVSTFAGITTSTSTLFANQLSVAGVGTFLSSNLKIRNPANTFEYSIVGSAIAANRSITLPLITATDTLAVLGLSQTFSQLQTFSAGLTVSSGTLTVSGGTITAGNVAATLLGGNTTTNITLGNALTSGTLAIGNASQTGTLTIGNATVSQTTNIQAGASGVGTIKTINLGTGGATGSFTNINIGPTAGIGTVVINSNTNLLVGTATSTGTASQRLQVTGGASFSGTGSNVGIGTTNPRASLEVNVNPTSYLTVNEVGTALLNIQASFSSAPLLKIDGTGFADLIRVTDNGSPVLYVRDGGNTGIGTTNPAELLDVFGNIRSSILSGVGNRAVYSDANGILTNSSSDETLKENVLPITYGLNVVCQLNPVSFNWIDTQRFGSQKEIGLIAQQVQSLIPEVVGVNYDETLSLDYSKLTSVLIKSIQDLKSENDLLRSEIVAIKQHVGITSINT